MSLTFASISQGDLVFLDANIFIFYYGAHPQFGLPCDHLLDRIDLQEFKGFTSTHVLCDVAHRLMTLEASLLFGWPMKNMANRMKSHPQEVQKLAKYRQALEEINLIGVQILPVLPHHVTKALDLTQRIGLLNSDALVLAMMNDHNLTKLASHDADFDQFSGITRYSPL